MNRYLLDMHCKQMGLTDEHIAQLLDINTATYYRKKVGKSDFTRKEMQKIRSVLNLTFLKLSGKRLGLKCDT